MRRTEPWIRDPLTRAVIGIIGIHSCLLGCLMLFAPRSMVAAFGFPGSIPSFFPSQAGIFLIILGILYLQALREQALVKVIILSKALAVAFLVFHSAFLSAPPIIWAAAGGDAAMLCATCLALRRQRHRQAVIAAGEAPAAELHRANG